MDIGLMIIAKQGEELATAWSGGKGYLFKSYRTIFPTGVTALGEGGLVSFFRKLVIKSDRMGCWIFPYFFEVFLDNVGRLRMVTSTSTVEETPYDDLVKEE